MSICYATPSPMLTLTLPPIHTCLDDDNNNDDIDFYSTIPITPYHQHHHKAISIPQPPIVQIKHTTTTNTTHHKKNQPSTPPLQSVVQPQDEIQKMYTLITDGNKDGVFALLAHHRSLSSSLLDLSHQYTQRQQKHPSPQPLFYTLLDECICMCSERGYHDMIEELLQQPWIQINAYREKDSMTPLFIAAENGHMSIVSLLILHGAHTNYNHIIKRQKTRSQPVTHFDDNKMATIQHMELTYMASVSTELEELGNDHDDDDCDDEDEDGETSEPQLDISLPIVIVDLILDYTRMMGTGGYPD